MKAFERSAIASFSTALRRVGTRKRASGEKKYLKSSLEFFGATKPDVRVAAREFHLANPTLNRAALIGLVRALWATDYHELRSVGIALLERYADLLRASDMTFVEELVRKSDTWAYVDWLAVTIGGSLAERYPSTRRVLPRWAGDQYMWIRRSSILVLLPSLKRRPDDFPLFERLAAPMLPEKDFFIRKAIGWILREVGKKRPAEVVRFVNQNIDTVSGLTLREGIKYLPPRQRETLLSRYKSR